MSLLEKDDARNPLSSRDRDERLLHPVPNVAVRTDFSSASVESGQTEPVRATGDLRKQAAETDRAATQKPFLVPAPTKRA
jgi:hypothetical protein